VNEKLLPPVPMCSTAATFATTSPPGAMMLKDVVSAVSNLPVAGLKFPPNREAPLSR